ncbi:MAG: hypothetical protein HKN76_00495 [Saprospiraceae bacterium]|nr:hypothetical protein [Saprospiraceae bacterium]
MKRTITFCIFIAIGLPNLFAGAVIEDLTDQILQMRNGDLLKMEYNFAGCFGPYHHGSIEMEMKADTIYYLSSSFDDKGKQPFNQSGKYHRDQLIKMLKKAQKQKSNEVLGNTISYRLISNGDIAVEGADKIEQRHFIELFHPFSNIFQKKTPDLIPKINNGGFVH